MIKKSKLVIEWCAEDVLQVRPDLDKKRALEVLRSVDHYHDASIGVNWNILKLHADDIFPPPRIT